MQTFKNLLRCFQHSILTDVAPILAMLFSTWYVVLCCPVLFWTSSVRPRFGYSSQLSAKFGSLARNPCLTADFSYLVQKSDLTAKCDCLAGISVLSPISGNLVWYSHLSPVFPCLVRNSSLSANLGILARISRLSSVFPCLVIFSCILQQFKQNSSRLSTDFACYLHISVPILPDYLHIPTLVTNTAA